LSGSQPVKIFHYTIVIDNGQLVGRETGSHKVVVLFVATMVRILFRLFCTDQCGSGRTMMTVGNIKSRHFSKFFGNKGNVFLPVNNPESMTEAVTRSDEVVDRFFCRILLDDCVQLVIIRISEENRLDVGIIHTNVLHTVFLFVTAGKFMLFNHPIHIIGNVCADYQSVLGFPVHGLGVNIIVFLAILHQPAFILEQLEIFCSFGIHTLIMLVCTYREINLRFNDMIKRLFVTFRFYAGLFGVQYVVRT